MSESATTQPRRRWLRWIASGVALVVLVLLLCRPVGRAIPGTLIERQEPRKADAIVVLAGDHQGGRVDHAAVLVREGHLPKGPVVVSGGPIYGDTTWAEMMRRRAVAQGISPDRIVLQDRSTTTVEDAQYTLPLLDERLEGQRPVVLLVTSAWHSERAAEAFREEAGDRFEIVSCPAPDPDPEWWNDADATRALATEVLKRLWPGPGG